MPSSRQDELLPTTSQSAAVPAKKPRNWLYWAIPTAILVAAVVGITVGVVVGTGGSSSSGSDATAAAAGTPASVVASPPASGSDSTAARSPSPAPSPAASSVAATSPAASGAAAGGAAAVPLPSPSPSPLPSPIPSPEPVAVKSGFTAAEVSAHNSPTDCWYIYGTKVVDITQYIASGQHPDGNPVMYPCCGRDCTSDFDASHRGSRALREQATFYIGDFIS